MAAEFIVETRIVTEAIVQQEEELLHVDEVSSCTSQNQDTAVLPQTGTEEADSDYEEHRAELRQLCDHMSRIVHLKGAPKRLKKKLKKVYKRFFSKKKPFKSIQEVAEAVYPLLGNNDEEIFDTIRRR